ncbi:MAG: formate--tetrahydrofolate ligase [Sphingomonadales bacterium]
MGKEFLSDIEIARNAIIKPIGEIAAKLDIPESGLHNFGPYKAKITYEQIDALQTRENGKLILVTAITPTPAGEGKTTTTVGLGDALTRIGKKAAVCIREASLGPCFGMKGGAAGGGQAQVIPMEDINLHFTGDIHAINAANNLLAAMVDNHVYWSNDLRLDPRRISWRRSMDMNDRTLRQIMNSIGGVANGFPRADGFDITAASEVMAIFCLSNDLDDLKQRLGNIIIGYTRHRDPIRAKSVEAAGAMTVLLKEAFQPNIVQTLEGTPSFIHGGPFANIAHGCNSVIATRTALKAADYVVTEAGFGSDLGAEKFFDIKCRKSGLEPNAVVLVATIRALKSHGGVEKGEFADENVAAVKKGGKNLIRHIENLRSFGIPVIVAINRFYTDTMAEVKAVKEICAGMDAKVVDCTHWEHGGEGTVDLANTVVDLIENSGPSEFKFAYDDNMTLWNKVSAVAKNIYRADDIIADTKVRNSFNRAEELGFGKFPVCIAKTQYSFSSDPNLKNAPLNHMLPIKELRISGGAEFAVAVCGDIMTMPGLPRVPAANSIDLNDDGEVVGLF